MNKKKSLRLAIYSHKFQYALVGAVAAVVAGGGDDTQNGCSFFFSSLSQISCGRHEPKTAFYVVHIKRHFSHRHDFRSNHSLTIQRAYSKQVVSGVTICFCVLLS